MKIRITGTEAELNQLTELLKGKSYVRSISAPYKNRGEYNKDYRLYIETYDSPETLTAIKQLQKPQQPEQITTEQGHQVIINFTEKEYKTLHDLKGLWLEGTSQDSDFIKRLIKMEYREKKEELEEGADLPIGLPD